MAELVWPRRARLLLWLNNAEPLAAHGLAGRGETLVELSCCAVPRARAFAAPGDTGSPQQCHRCASLPWGCEAFRGTLPASRSRHQEPQMPALSPREFHHDEMDPVLLTTATSALRDRRVRVGVGHHLRSTTRRSAKRLQPVSALNSLAKNCWPGSKSAQCLGPASQAEHCRPLQRRVEFRSNTVLCSCVDKSTSQQLTVPELAPGPPLLAQFERRTRPQDAARILAVPYLR